MATALAFIGTGAMGAPMAARLVAAGYTLTVHNRSRAKAQTLIEAGARWAGSPAEAAEGAEIVLTCLPNNEATHEVLLGAGGVGTVKGVACVVDLSTSGPPTAAAIGQALAGRGIGFVDAPVTGGPARAAAGTITVIASGEAGAIARARPALEAIGSNIFVAGPHPGQAQMVKLVNNMLNYLALAASAEAMVLGTKAGLDPQLMVDVLNTGTGKNSATEVKIPKAVLTRSFNYGATNYTVNKDLHLFLDEAERMKVEMPITRLLANLWEGWARDHASEDLTTIAKLFEGRAGVEMHSRPA